MSEGNTKYDDILWTIGQQAGGVPEFLSAIACFLKRRTDFFSGASEKQWETLLLKTFRQEYDIFLNERNSSSKYEESHNKDTEEISKSEKRITTIANTNSTTSTLINEELSQPIQIASDETENEEVGKLIPNSGNGCTLPNYSWTQTLKEIELKIPLNIVEALRSRDINVNITKKSLTVGIKGQKPIVDGELCEEIKPEETTWMLQDGKIISIMLEKRKQINWWDRLIMSDPIIAVRKITPEPSKLSDLDDGTRATVEKMLYNQRQKQMGLPTSEDQEKMKIIDNFKKTHPELDFSQCKF